MFLSLCQKFALRFALAHMVNVPLVASAKNILLHSKCWAGRNGYPTFFFHSSSILFHKGFFLIPLIQGSKRVHFPFQRPSISIFSKSFGQEIIGFEGIWGVLMMVVVVYPALWLIPGPDHGHQEEGLLRGHG